MPQIFIISHKEDVISMCDSLIGVTQDLSSFQMLVISLFTDIGPSLSLIMEPPEKDLLKQPPRAKTDHLVNWKFLLQVFNLKLSLLVFFLFFHFKFEINFLI